MSENSSAKWNGEKAVAKQFHFLTVSRIGENLPNS